MTKEFSSIAELKSIRELKSSLSERETELSTPLSRNLSLMPEIYEVFKSAISEKGCRPDPGNVMQRKKFLFITLFIFAPSSLAGSRLPEGIRSRLTEVFPNVAPCVISNNISEASFLYSRYKDFRIEVEHIYKKVVEYLRSKGEIA